MDMGAAGLKSSSVRFLAVRRTLPVAADAQATFARLSSEGTAPGSVLLQSSDNIPKYGERSLAAVGASLCVQGKEERFWIEALDARGRCLLPELFERLSEVAD